MKKLIICISTLLLLSSCNIYKVHTDDDKKRGIPFLTKTVQLEQQTTYQKDFVDVSLNITPMKGDSIVEGMRKVTFGPVKMSLPEKEELRIFKRSILETDSISFSQINTLIEIFKELPTIDLDAKTDNIIRNRVVRNIVVSEEVHYLNGKHHFFGSSTLDFELNDDNTLTKSSIESTSNVTEFATSLLTSVIPVSEVITNKLKLDSETVEEKETGIKISIKQDLRNTLQELGLFDDAMAKDIDDIFYTVSLDLSPGALQFTFVDIVSNYEDAKTPLLFTPKDGFFTVKEIKPGSEPKPKSAEPEEKNAIQINGRVILPEN